MLVFTKEDVRLVVSLGNLENLHILQVGLLQLIGRQSADPIEVSELGAVTGLLQATLFDKEQLEQIEAMFQKKATIKQPAQAA